MSYDAVMVDAGTGNLFSVRNALCHLGYNILVSREPQEILAARRIVLPGVGAFARFMEGLRQYGLDDAVKDAVSRQLPLLGICVGLQAFFEAGEEMGEHPGLALLSGRVVRFPGSTGAKIPQTGWNQVRFERPSALLQGLNSGDYVYFNHSYYCRAGDPADVLGATEYDGVTFASMAQRGALFGVQFHPEKSQRVGLKILDNFMKV